MKNVGNRSLSRQLGLLIVPLVLCPALGLANSAAIQSFTNPTVWPNFDDEDWSLGFEFSVIGSVTVDALGYNYFGVPLNNSHEVGLYNQSEVLLGSVTVTNGSTLSNGYLYSSLSSPVVLTTGNYWIAGTTLGENDGWIYTADSIVTLPSITYDSSWYNYGGGGVLSFPDNLASDRQYLEVNFLASSSPTVPEPSSLALMGSTLPLLAFLRRKLVDRTRNS